MSDSTRWALGSARAIVRSRLGVLALCAAMPALLATAATAGLSTDPGSGDTLFFGRLDVGQIRQAFNDSHNDRSYSKVTLHNNSDTYPMALEVASLQSTDGSPTSVWSIDLPRTPMQPEQSQSLTISFAPTQARRYQAVLVLKDVVQGINPAATFYLQGDGVALTWQMAGDIWWDKNGNGIQDPDEPCVDGTVSLQSIYGEWERTTQSVGCWDSGYRFSGLTEGDYLVSVKAPDDPCFQPGPPVRVHVSSATTPNGTIRVDVPVIRAQNSPCSGGTPALTQITALPTDSCHSASVTLSGTANYACSVPRNFRTSIVGNQVRVEADVSRPIGVYCLQVMTPWSQTINLGQLGPDTYQIAYLENGQFVGRTSLAVLPCPPANAGGRSSGAGGNAGTGGIGSTPGGTGTGFPISYAATVPGHPGISSAPPGAPVLIEGVPAGDDFSVSLGGLPVPQVSRASATELLFSVPSAPAYPFMASAVVKVNGQQLSGRSFTITAPIPGVSNLLMNGSFDLPDTSGSPYFWGYTYGVPSPANAPSYRGASIPGWQIIRGTIDVSANGQQPPGVGKQSIDLVGSPGAATIEQTFYTVPGQLYRFTGWISHNPGAGHGRANVFVNGTPLGQVFHSIPNSEDTKQWRPFELDFRATATQTTLQIADVTGASDVQGTELDGLAVDPAN